MGKLEERDLDWVDRAPIRIELDRRTSAAPDVVFAVLADHERWPTWFAAMKSARGDGTTGVGSTRQVILGPLKADERFLAWEPGRRFSFLVTRASAPGLAAMLEDFRLEPGPSGGTALTYVVGLEPARPLRFLAPVVRGVFLRQITKAIDALVRHCDQLDRGTAR